jgi:hypothetical protein
MTLKRLRSFPLQLFFFIVLPDFDGGLAVFDQSGTLIASTNDAAIWEARAVWERLPVQNKKLGLSDKAPSFPLIYRSGQHSRFVDSRSCTANRVSSAHAHPHHHLHAHRIMIWRSPIRPAYAIVRAQCNCSRMGK